MRKLTNVLRSGLALAICSLAACSSGPSAPGSNAFLDEAPEDGKADTGYLNTTAGTPPKSELASNGARVLEQRRWPCDDSRGSEVARRPRPARWRGGW